LIVIHVARKPLSEPTVAANVTEHGTGGLNIDGCRIGEEGGGTTCNRRDEQGRCQGHPDRAGTAFGVTYHAASGSGIMGRFPTNLILTQEASSQFPKYFKVTP